MRVWNLLFVSVIFLGACSYSLRRGDQPLTKLDGQSLATGVQSIYIPMIENLSTTVAPESVLTEALREVFATQPGLKVVSSESEAEYILLGRVRQYGTSFATATSPSSAAAQKAGGLVEGQVTAADIKVYMWADFELLENTSAKLRRSLWTKGIQEEAAFEAYNRQDELSGASSAPHVNRSREYLQLRKISRTVARKILDQVSQDF